MAFVMFKLLLFKCSLLVFRLSPGLLLVTIPVSEVDGPSPEDPDPVELVEAPPTDPTPVVEDPIPAVELELEAPEPEAEALAPDCAKEMFERLNTKDRKKIILFIHPPQFMHKIPFTFLLKGLSDRRSCIPAC